MAKKHTWRFFRAGGFDQVRLDSGEDLMALDQLDQKLTLEHTADTARIFAQTHFNGDGIIPVDSDEEDATKGAINDIVACFGSELDRSGKPGITQDKVDRFYQEAQAFSDWWKKAE